ncbi:MAG: hypothetical protein HYR66_01105 [Sphingobacteriales bacterium]|nr:hypothetical protein [Sphingobacteriales bacterium]MBI3720777.1 hypothetical protein [Sphingobacteriales bacterium]
MQRKLPCLIIAVCAAVITHAQNPAKDSSINYTKEYVDSLLANDTLMKEFNAFVDSITAPKSYFDISAGFSNRIFSVRNTAFNSQQVSSNKFTLTPTLSYINKTGLGLSFSSFLIFDGSNTGFYQHAITPSFDNVKNDNVAFGFSFTHYIVNNSKTYNTTPFNNEVYGYIIGKKGWLQPGLAAGWAGGKYSEIYKIDTFKLVTIGGITKRINFTIRDTVHTTIKDFSVTASLQHEFDWTNIFDSDDEFTFTPTLMLSAGAQDYAIKQSASVSLKRFPLRLRRLARGANGNTGFQFQSAGLSLSGNYTTGKFYIAPQYYLDYYLPNDLAAGEKRLNGFFNVTLGVTF